MSKTKPSDPEEGTNRYCVYLKRFLCYTVIGAENIHHAANKASKLWGPHWTNISYEQPSFNSIMHFVSVKEFGKLIKTASLLPQKQTNA